MPNTRDIQRRIKSVKNIAKITRAMEMVAAAKMRRATEAVLKTRSYANLSWTTILHLLNEADYHKLHPLLAKRPGAKKVALIMFAANRGLCGSFSGVLLNKAQASIKSHETNERGEAVEHVLLISGKKGLALAGRFGHKLEAEFVKTEGVPTWADISPIATHVTNEFLAGRYDKVVVAYTDFVSPVQQLPRVKQLLPIDYDAADDHLGVVGQSRHVGADKAYLKGKEEKYLSDTSGYRYNFLYEPNAMVILDKMIPRLITTQLLQAALESNASEHSARMAAMHQANQSAGEVVDELTLSYNKMRQAGITAEIAEIAAGAAALN